MSDLSAYLAIYAISLFLNWLVQLGYYLFTTHKDPRAFAGQKTLLEYYTGFIGDGIIVPLINILIFIFIVNSGFEVSFSTILVALAAGLGLDVLTHYFQGKAELTNWSMPEPFSWNFAGKWHMISFPIQISYLCLFLIAFWHDRSLALFHRSLAVASLEIVGLCALFFFLFLKDYDFI